jgi:hypothetical protein
MARDPAKDRAGRNLSKYLIELRSLLEQEFDNIASAKGDASTPEVLAAIRKLAPTSSDSALSSWKIWG